MKQKIWMLVAGLVLVASSQAFAWGDLGHQTTAQIAEKLLETDPNTRRQMQDILGVEPLAMAAVWADQARNDDRFAAFNDYHFYTVFQDPKKHNEKDALIVLQKFPALVIDPSSSRETKMLALRYLIHVLGDIHQPLHIGNEFDRGGNSCKVKWQPDIKDEVYTTNLHIIWDTNLVNYIALEIRKYWTTPVKYFGYKEVAAALMEKHKNLLDLRQPVAVEAWMKESSNYLSEAIVYPDNTAADKRQYCNADWKKIPDNQVPLLDRVYVKKAADLAEMRMVLAGVRMAKFMKQLFSKSRPTGPTEMSILKSLDIKNN